MFFDQQIFAFTEMNCEFHRSKLISLLFDFFQEMSIFHSSLTLCFCMYAVATGHHALRTIEASNQNSKKVFKYWK